MTTTQSPELTVSHLITALGGCLDEFETIEHLCTQCESKLDMLVAQHLLISARDLATFAIDSIAMIAMMGRIPTAHACIESVRDPQHPAGERGTLDTSPTMPVHLFSTVDLLLAVATDLRNTLRMSETTASKPIPGDLAIDGIRHIARLTASLKTLADKFVAAWPSETDQLELTELAASPIHVANALATARGALALHGDQHRLAPSLPDRLDDTLCRLAAMAGKPNLTPAF